MPKPLPVQQRLDAIITNYIKQAAIERAATKIKLAIAYGKMQAKAIDAMFYPPEEGQDE